jgi:hypothetical protein
MAVDDRAATGELRAEPRRPPSRRSRNVHHPDPRSAGLDHMSLRQRSLQHRLVHVPEHGLDRRPEPAQLVENSGRDEVAAVEDQIGRAAELDAARRKLALSARQVSVRDDRERRRARQASLSGLWSFFVFNVATRFGFMSAVSLTLNV